MYLLVVKDGLLTRYIGPYITTKQASDDSQRVLSTCSNRASWQIHALEKTNSKLFPLKRTISRDENIRRAT